MFMPYPGSDQCDIARLEGEFEISGKCDVHQSGYGDDSGRIGMQMPALCARPIACIRDDMHRTE